MLNSLVSLSQLTLPISPSTYRPCASNSDLCMLKLYCAAARLFAIDVSRAAVHFSYLESSDHLFGPGPVSGPLRPILRISRSGCGDRARTRKAVSLTKHCDYHKQSEFV